jgi:hypothetical protein
MKTRKVFMLFHGHGESAEFYGVYATAQAAEFRIDNLPEWLANGMHIEPRTVTKAQLEDIIEDNLTDEQFERGLFA